MSKYVVALLIAIGVCLAAGAYAADDAAPAPAEAAAAAPAPAADPAEVVAFVGDAKVTRGELDRELARMTRGRPGAAVPADQQHKMLDNLIKRRIVTILANKAGTVCDAAEVDKIMAEQKANFPSEEEYTKRLAAVGLTEADLKTMVTEGTLQQKFVDTLTKDLAISDEELQAKYEEVKATGDLKREESADVAHILVKVEGTDEAVWTEAKTKIDAARKRIVDGEDFAAVAKEVTDDPGSKNNGGEYKDTPRGQMVPEFDQRMFSQKIGEVSEPFKTQFGWHILKVNKRSEAGEMSFDEIKDKLKQYLLDQKKGELLDGEIEKAKATLEIKIQGMPEITETAPQMMPMQMPVQQ